MMPESREGIFDQVMTQESGRFQFCLFIHSYAPTPWLTKGCRTKTPGVEISSQSLKAVFSFWGPPNSIYLSWTWFQPGGKDLNDSSIVMLNSSMSKNTTVLAQFVLNWLLDFLLYFFYYFSFFSLTCIWCLLYGLLT